MLNLVFDLDGTLIHSLPSIHFAADKVFRSKGLPGFPDAVVRGFVGDGAGALVSRLLQHVGMPATGALQEELLGDLIDAYETAHHLTTLYPGALAALHQQTRAPGFDGAAAFRDRRAVPGRYRR
jgi:phosphoglycolate phosphatase